METQVLVAVALGFVLGFVVEWAYDLFVSRRRRLSNGDQGFTNEIASLKNENARLSAVANSTTIHDDALERVRSEVKVRDAKIKELTAQVHALTLAQQELVTKRDKTGDTRVDARLSAELEGMKNELRLKGETVAALEARVRELESDQEESDPVKNELLALRSENEVLTNQLSAFEEELQARAREADQFRSEVADLRASAGSGEDSRVLAARAAALERDVESLKAISAAKDQAVAQSQETLAKLEAQLAFRPRPEDLQQLNEQIAARDSALESLRTNLEQIQEELQASEVQRLTLEAELRETSEELALARAAQNHSLEQESPEAREPNAALRELEEKVGRLMRSVEAMERAKSTTVEPVSKRPTPPILSVTSFAREAIDDKDPLIQIRGIGHLFERKLWDAGVHTFAQLAALQPEDILEIIQPAEWQRIEPERWISEAAALALGTGT